MTYRFLLAPLLALAVLGAAPGTSELPPIPKTVYSRYGPVPVERVAVVACPDSTGKTDPSVIGCYQSSPERHITLADTLDLRWSWFVLEHEICHVAFRDLGVAFNDKQDEERICWVQARWRVGDLESRP